MTTWLCKEETLIEQNLFVPGTARSIRAKRIYSILLRAVRVLDNKRLFLSSDVIVYAITVDGFPDMKSGKRFWIQQLNFPNVKDGTELTVDPDNGVLIYRGRPRDFLNLYILVLRDTKSTRELAKILQENFVAKGLGTLAGAAVSIYSGLPPTITAPLARELTTQTVETSLDYFAKRSNLAVGVYYGSLLKENKYGTGLHPSNYPAASINCGDALEIAYEVRNEAT